MKEAFERTWTLFLQQSGHYLKHFYSNGSKQHWDAKHSRRSNNHYCPIHSIASRQTYSITCNTIFHIKHAVFQTFEITVFFFKFMFKKYIYHKEKQNHAVLLKMWSLFLKFIELFKKNTLFCNWSINSVSV